MATKTRVECLLFVIGAGRGWLTQYKKTVCLCVCLNHSIVCPVYYLFRIDSCSRLWLPTFILDSRPRPGGAELGELRVSRHMGHRRDREDTQGWGDNYQHHWAIRENMSRNTRGNDSLSVYWELICEARGMFALQPQRSRGQINPILLEAPRPLPRYRETSF